MDPILYLNDPPAEPLRGLSCDIAPVDDSSVSKRRTPSLRGETFQRLVSVIGVEGALKLAVHFGGQRLCVPRAPRPGSELVHVLGEELAQRLAKEFGGVWLTPPGLKPLEATWLRKQIVSLRESGETVRGIARTLGCSERHVYSVLQRAREAADSSGDA